MIDARRMEVYTAIFDHKLAEVEYTHAKIIDTNSFAPRLQSNFIAFIGDGAMKCKDTIVHANAHFFTDNYNSANYMSSLAYHSFQENNFEDVAYFEPFYLKDFVATTPKKRKV
jgi:tRNA threonylcarbamoyladenosine biosynthesis protein TsaB